MVSGSEIKGMLTGSASRCCHSRHNRRRRSSDASVGQGTDTDVVALVKREGLRRVRFFQHFVPTICMHA